MGSGRSEASEDTRAGAPTEPGWLSDGPLKRLLGNASLLVGGRSLNGVFNLAAMTLIVRSVGLETFGALVLVHAFASTLSDLAKFQSWQAVLRYGTPALDSGRTADFRRLIKLTVRLDLGAALAGIMIAFVVAPLIAPTLGWSAEQIPAVQRYAISILFMVTATPTGLLRLFDRFDLLSVSNAIGSFIRLIGAIWISFQGGDLDFLLGLWFLSTAASGSWLIGHSIRALASQGLLGGPPTRDRRLVEGHPGIGAFVLTTQANTTLSAGMRQLATVVVGALLDATAAGLFDLSRQMTTLLTRLARLMKPAIYPEFARLSTRDDLPGIRRLMFRSMALMSGVGLVLVLGFAVFGRPLLGTIFGKEAEAAYGLVVWMAVAAGIRLLSFPLEPALISTGRAGAALLVRAATVLVFLTCMATAIPALGLVGAGVATLASEWVAVAGQGLAVRQWFKTRKTQPASAPDPGDPPAEAPTPES